MSEENELVRVYVEVAPVRFEPDRDEGRPCVMWLIPCDRIKCGDPFFVLPGDPEEDQDDDTF